MAGMLLAMPVAAQEWTWGVMGLVSPTLGATPNRLCVGAAADRRPGDLGCPSYSPFLDPTSGYLGLGTAAPLATLDVVGTISASSAIQVGQSTLACGTEISGSIRYNTTSDTLQICTGSGWKSLVSGTTAAGSADLAGLTDVELTNLAGRDYLRYDTGSSKWVNISESTVMSTTTMVSGWPDAITCYDDSNTHILAFHLAYNYSSTGGDVGYRYIQNPIGSDYRIVFNSDGSYDAGNSSLVGYSNDCARSLSSHESLGHTFNFIGNSGAGSTAQGDRIISDTQAMIINEVGGYVSLSADSGATSWGYLGSTASYLPRLNSNIVSATLVSATNISGSLIQVGAGNGSSCDASTKGAIRYSNTSSTVEYCNSTAWVSMGPSDTVPVSFRVHKNGTNQTVVANTWTKLTWSHETQDTNNNFSSDRFQPTVPGNYLLIGSANCSGTTGCTVRVDKNGSASAHGNFVTTTTSSARSNVVAIVSMNGTTDYVELSVFNTGGTSVLGGEIYTYFQGSLLGPQVGGGAGGATALNDLTDVDTTGAATGKVLAYDGSNWVISDSAVASSALGDRITSGTVNVIVNEVGGYVSLTAGATTWGYLSNTLSYLPTLMASRVSSTNVSTTIAQFAPQSVASLAGGGGNFIVSGTTSVSASEAGTINFATGGSQRMIVGSSGNVGIGTASPAVMLDIKSQSSDADVMRISANGGSGSDVGKAYLAFHHWLTGTYPSARIGVEETDVADFDASLVFQTRSSDSDSAPTTKMTITEAGNVGIGTTTPSYKLHVAGSRILTEGVAEGLTIRGAATGSANSSFIGFDDSAGTRKGYVGDGSGSNSHIYLVSDAGNIYASGIGGGCYVNTGGCTSDRRLKTDIENLYTHGGILDKVAALQGVSYRWKQDSDKVHIGFIAQDVQKLFPELVEQDDEYLMVNYRNMIVPVVQALRELKVAKDSQISRTAALEAQNAELLRRLEALERQIGGR